MRRTSGRTGERHHPPHRVALTGTPGTGKTGVAKLLKGWKVVDLNALITRDRLWRSRDARRGAKVVDVEQLREAVATERGPVIFEGHLAHELPVDLAIVMRCAPSELARRLRARGWPAAKIRENMEAEAVDVILIEALARCPEVCEIDTTGLMIPQVAAAIQEVLAGEREKYRPGRIDWSDEVLRWF